MKKILIISHDTEYIERIEMEVALAVQSDVRIEFVTDNERIEEINDEKEAFDLVFLDAAVSFPKAKEIVAGKKLYLVEGKDANINSVNKLEGSKAVIAQLGSEILQSDDNEVRKTTILIHVFSISGGSGKTLTALGMASQYAAMGKRTLYINSDELQDFLHFLKEEIRGYASEALAIAIADNNAMRVKTVLQEVHTEGFDFVPPFKHFLSAYRLTKEHFAQLARQIAEAMKYDVIVLEHPEGMQEAMVTPKRKDEKVVLVGEQTALCAERMTYLAEMSASEFKGCIIVCGKATGRDKNYLGIAANAVGTVICEKVAYRSEINLKEMVEQGVFRRTVEAALL